MRQQFATYVAIQLIVYIMDVGIFYAICFVQLTHPPGANIAGKSIAALVAFYAHKAFTFKHAQQESTLYQAIKYAVVVALNVPASTALLMILMYAGLEPVAAKVISDIGCVALTFWLSKFLVFKGNDKGAPKKLVP